MSLSSQVDAAIQRIGEVVKGKADAADLDAPDLIDGVTEWWCQPVATTVSDPHMRTVFGTIAENGDILACEFNHSTRKTKRYKVGQAFVDDHNAPALWYEPGRRPIIMWTNHNKDSQVWFKVGTPDGNLESLVNAPQGSYSINQASSRTSAYTQAFKINHLSNDRVDTLWIFTRGGGTAWGYTVLEIDQATGEAIAVKPWLPVITGGSKQFYIIGADGHEGPGKPQILRLAAGFNPAQPVHDIYYFEINVETEVITSPMTPGVSRTISQGFISGDAMPFDPAVPDPVSNDSRSARLMYVRPGPDTPAIAYATWARGSEDNATYKVTELVGGKFVSAGSYMRTENASDIPAFPRGFDFSCVFEVPNTVPSIFGLGAMVRLLGGGVTGNVFFVRVTSAGNIRVAGYAPSGSASAGSDETKNAPLAADLANAGSILGVRVRYDLDNRLITRYVSRDGGASWDPLDAGTVMGSSYDSMVSTGLNTNRHNDSQLRVPKGSSEDQDGLVNVVAFSLKNLDGTELAGMDLSRGEYRSGYGSPARMIRSLSTVSEVTTAWETTSFGVSGPRIGYTPLANYVAGMAFENPSSARAVVTAHSGGGMETVRRWAAGEAGYESQDVLTRPTSESRVIRPYVPINESSSDAIMVNSIRRYGETFKDYLGDIINLR